MDALATSPPRVSVIVIFLNEEKYLRQAIESVLIQTFTNWELLLVDDGSTDRSQDIASEFAASDPQRVRVLEHPGRENRGMSASRNLGIRHARGQEIALLDGDDVWLPEKLAEQTTILDQHPSVAMTYGPLILWHSWKPGIHQDGRYGVSRYGEHPYADSVVQPPRVLELLLKEHAYIPSGALMRRSACHELGGFEDQFRGSFEDAVFQTKMCARFPVYVHGQSLYQYRIHDESHERTNNPLRERINRHVRFLDWAADYLAGQGLNDRAVQRMLARTRWRCRHPLYAALHERLRVIRGRVEQNIFATGRRLLPAPLRNLLWGVFSGRRSAP